MAPLDMSCSYQSTWILIPLDLSDIVEYYGCIHFGIYAHGYLSVSVYPLAALIDTLHDESLPS